MTNNGIIRVTVVNLVIVGLMAMIFSKSLKVVLAKHYVQGLSELVAA